MVNKLVFSNIDMLNFCGDIHGNFETLGYNIDTRYKMENSLTIVCGDIGMGFHKIGYYKQTFDKINKRLKKNNNHVVFFRGNHDNPIYFNDPSLLGSYSNIHLIPDYTVVEAIGKNILCIGGGISIDRTLRSVNSYWEDENVVYDEEKLKEINEEYPFSINIVATHSCPNFAFPTNKDGIRGWLEMDKDLEKDIDIERKNLTKIYDYLIDNNQINITHWMYGHFHDHRREIINDIRFSLHNCEEIIEFVNY